MESLISKALEHGAAVEVLERLLSMRERLKTEAARQAFFEALSAFQAACPVIPKTKTARVESRSGGSYTYHYAPLEVIVATVAPLLREHGLSYRFDTAFEEGPPAQVVTCIVHHRDGHSESSTFRTPVDAGARMNDMQKSASAQTYAKRYAFCNALGILTGDEDNDGHGGSSGTGVRPAGAGVRNDRVQPAVAAAAPARQATTPAPLGRNLVRIQRPQQAQPDSDGPSTQPASDTGPTTVAETPAGPAGDPSKEAAERKAELRLAIIKGQVELLRLLSQYKGWDEDALWNRANDVADQWCSMGFNKPLVEMSRVDLERANQRMQDTVRQRTGAVA